jgi:lipopolysaccharide biosynthesis glycosyltransferase
MQFSYYYTRQPKKIQLKLLSNGIIIRQDDKNCKVWHRTYQYSGIQYCEYAIPDIIHRYKAFNQVNPIIFAFISKKNG